MQITKIEKEKNKNKIWVDENYTFSLYTKEMNQYNISLNSLLDDNTLGKIREEVIYKRGVTYLYHLIAKRDYTTFELENKLKNAGYIIEDIIHIVERVKEQGFIDDLSYVRRYVEQMLSSKSIKQIQFALYNKGLDMNVVNSILDEFTPDEHDLILKLVNKKIKGKKELTFTEKSKLYHYLETKGFKGSKIREVLDDYPLVEQ